MAFITQKPTTLNDFVSFNLPQLAQILQPNNKVNQDIGIVVNKVANCLKQHLQPVKIIKGGSYGKGTNLCDRKEVDIVIVLPDYTPNEKNCTEKIIKLKQCISNLIKEEPNEVDYCQQKDDTGNIIIKLRSICFVLDGVKVDLLPGCLLPQGAKSFIDMDRKAQLPFASASASEMQVKFIKHQDARYKDLVRICKCWRDLDWNWSDGCRPSSYLIELLALYVYESLDKKTFNLDAAFRKFLYCVNQYPLKIWWGRYYDVDNQYAMLRKDQQVVLDPANPTNNVAWCIKNWGPFETNAQQTLKAMDSPISFQFTSVIDNIQKDINGVKQEMASFKQNVESQLNLLKQDLKFNTQAFLTSTTGKFDWHINWIIVNKNKTIVISPRFFANGIRCVCTLELDQKGWAIMIVQETDNPVNNVNLTLDVRYPNNYYNHYNNSKTFQNTQASKSCGWYIETERWPESDIKLTISVILT